VGRIVSVDIETDAAMRKKAHMMPTDCGRFSPEVPLFPGRKDARAPWGIELLRETMHRFYES
jgi:hypothetical protein